MIPYTQQRELLISTFKAANPIRVAENGRDYPLREPTEEFLTYFEHCINTNEIRGLEFLHVDALGYYSIPLLIDGVDKKLVYQEVIEPNLIPGMPHGLRQGEIIFNSRQYFRHQDFVDLEMLTTADDPMYIMAESKNIALRILKRSTGPLGIVCGPISSGKLSIPENIRVFNRTVFKIGQRIPIFNQLPFEPGFHRVHELIKHDSTLCPDGNSSAFFIEHFYEKIFRMYQKWLPHFIYGWEHSTGARIERHILKELKCKSFDLREHFADRIL